MGLKQLKRIKNERELSKYDGGKENIWNTPKPSYPGYNGWDWGSSKFNTSLPNSAPSNINTQPIQNTNSTLDNVGSVGQIASTATGGAAFGIGTSAISFGGSLLNSFGGVQSVQQLQNDAGQSYGSIGGMSYTKQNNIDKDKEMSTLGAQNTSNTIGTAGSGALLGASVGSIIPGLGTIAGGVIGGAAGLIGGLFGGASRKRKLRRQMYEAQQLTDRTNQFNRSNADTQSLQQQYAQKYGNNDNQLLYANKGKDIKNDFKKKRIVLKQPK